MLKFLRKYNKWILAVGGTLLMVAFVAPQAFQGMGGNAGGQVIATYAGGRITIGERQAAARELDILSRFGLAALGLIPGDGEGTDGAVHWILLNRLAEQADLVGGPADGRDFLEYAARQVAIAQARLYAEPGTEEHRSYEDILVQIVTQQMEGARESMLANGFMPDEIDTMLARARGVYRMYETYFEAAKLSDLDAIEAARQSLDQVGVNQLIMRSARFVPQAPEARPEQFEEFFEKYKDVERGEPPHGFGYRFRPAVRLEWLHIERGRIEDRVIIDPVEANAHWRRNRETYPGEWAEEQRRVIADLRAQRTDGIIDEANRVVAAEVRREESKLPEEGGFRTLPEDWPLTRPSLTAIALRVQDMLRERYGLEVDRPNVQQLESQWFTRDGFSRFTGFQNAFIQNGPMRVGTPDVCFSVRELDPSAETTYQAGLVYGPARVAESGDIFFFRVTDVRPAQAPQAIEEVRAEVGQDVARWNAYQMLLEWDPMLRELMMEGGLKAVSERFNLPMEEQVAVSRTGVNPPQDLDFDQDFVREAILNQAQRLNPRRMALQQSMEDRIVIVPLPYALAIAVVEIIDQRPVSRELFRQREPRAAAQAKMELLADSPDDWPYSFESLTRSMELRWRRGEEPVGASPAQASAG